MEAFLTIYLYTTLMALIITTTGHILETASRHHAKKLKLTRFVENELTRV